ncbi:hypothetical protein ACJMK2_039003 [Sinanodonta woodiana]|uniref:Uncharacterized protein n=1 Tax=Sinanodonta woodiana TaxID=1069815 RepID=A0ABD3WCL9_SINWO
MGCGATVPLKAAKNGHGPVDRDPAKFLTGGYTEVQEARLVREKSMRDRQIKILKAADEKAEKALEEREHLSLGNRSRNTSRATSRTTSPTGKKKHVLFKHPDEKMKPLEEKYKSQESLIENTQSKEKISDKSSPRKTNSFKEQGIDSKKEPDFSEINSISSPRNDIPKNSIPNGLNISGINSSLQQKESNIVHTNGLIDSHSRGLKQTRDSDVLHKDFDNSQNDHENKSHESKEKKKKKSHSKDVDDKVEEGIASAPSGVDTLEEGGENHKHKKKRKKKKAKDQEEMMDVSVENKIQVVTRDEDRAHSRSSVRSDGSSKRG